MVAGTNLTYTLTVSNNRPDNASGVTLTDTLPAGVNLVSATPSQGNCAGTTTVICNLGATINFVAGSVRRAPAFFQHHGLEWLWRIKEEPALWTRYALDLATLMSVLIVEILPGLVQHALQHKMRATPSSSPHLQHYHGRNADVLKFFGDWTRDDLAPVRASLTAATLRTTNLIVDLESVTFVDAAFLGQILLAYGYQRRMHRDFSLRASTGRIQHLLRLHGCEFLLAPGRLQPEAAPTSDRPASSVWASYRPIVPRP